MGPSRDTSLAQGGGGGDGFTPAPDAFDDDDSVASDGEADTMDALLAAVAAAPPVPLDRTEGLSIRSDTLIDGSYRVLRRLGGGGMGVVYLAEHVELQRQVALKLHLGAVDSQELMRLRREARVMARLSHPHVLAVHGVGTHEGRMFIAMEYAEGGTLETWLEAGPRSWRDVVAMLMQAGRGLAAAHRMGVVHRDFKPDNVLIGADGRPRVADFGLARRCDDPGERVTGPSPMLPDDAHHFTVTGAVVGTPAYMSPEQFDGIEVGPASDQFSFCVVLHEALLGFRPFSGRTMLELAEAVHTGRLRPPPPGVRVPKRLLALVARGLRPVPGDRHPSMESLVEALERVHGASRRRLRWAVGTTTLAAALLVGNQVAVMVAPKPCEHAEEGLGAAWDEARREAVVAAWPRQAAGTSPGEALEVVDAWVADWRAQRRETCHATHVQQVQSDLAFTLRMACLDRMAARLDALTGELAEGGGGEPSVALVRAELPVLAQCEDVEALDQLVNRFSSASMRSDPEQDRAWIEADALLTRALTRQRLGRPGWVALTEQALALAQRHELTLVETSALALLVDDRLARGDTADAAALADRALRLALSVGHDEGASELVLNRAEAALAAGRPEDAALHLSYFEALLSRIRRSGKANSYRRRAQVVRGRVHLAQGEAEAAVQELAPLTDDPTVELALRRTALTAVGAAHEKLGQHAQAIEAAQRLIDLIEREHGADAPGLVPALNNLAMARLSLGQPDTALDELARAEAIITASLGAEHPYLPAVLTNAGLAQRRLGHLAKAQALQERSLALRLRIYGDAHPSPAYALDELGDLARLRGALDEALAHLGRARSLREDSFGPDHPLVADTLTRTAQVHLEQTELAQAEALLRRAETILGRQAGDPRDRAEVALLLARVLEDRDLAEARRWASAAQEHAAQAGAPGDALRTEAQAWLAARPQPQ